MAKQSKAGAEKLRDEQRTREQLLDELQQLLMENAYLQGYIIGAFDNHAIPFTDNLNLSMEKITPSKPYEML